MYGIPNMKLEKDTVKRRVDLLASEGIEFVTGANIGVDVDVNDVRASCDALVLTVGSTKPRDLPVPGREVGRWVFVRRVRSAQAFYSCQMNPTQLRDRLVCPGYVNRETQPAPIPNTLSYNRTLLILYGQCLSLIHI